MPRLPLAFLGSSPWARTRRAVVAALLAIGTSLPAHGAEVELRLESVLTGVGCGAWGYGCVADVPAALSPEIPSGSGDLDLDPLGNLQGATLQVDAFLLDGVAVPSWSRPLVPGALPGTDFWLDPGDTWGDVDLVVLTFVSPDVFAGELRHLYEVVTSSGAPGALVLETYTFTTDPAPPGIVPLPCPGARLHVDADADGEEDQRDRAPLGATSGAFGTGVDGAGRTIADFCALEAGGSKRCARLDFANDEALPKRPQDCRLSENACVPAARRADASPPPFAGPVCAGHPVFSDADGDGESDLTDRCPLSPGSPVDDHGCFVAEFCALQPLALCARADFANDEPGIKRPRDCERGPRQCRAAE